MAEHPAPMTPPFGVAPGGSRPPTRQERVHTPTAQEGAPGRGDGPESHPGGGGGGLAWAVAGGPTLEWGGGGMVGDTAAAALRLPLAPSLTKNVPRGSPPPAGSGSVHESGRQPVPPDRGATGGGMPSSRRRRRARLGVVTSTDRLTTVERVRLAQELWLTCRHALLPPPLAPPFAPCDRWQLTLWVQPGSRG